MLNLRSGQGLKNMLVINSYQSDQLVPSDLGSDVLNEKFAFNILAPWLLLSFR